MSSIWPPRFALFQLGSKRSSRRIDIDLPDGYYAWTDYLALLDESLIACVTSSSTTEAPNAVCPRSWQALPYIYWCHRRVGKNWLWIYPWNCGWSVECYFPEDRIAGVLTTDNMP